MRVIVVGMSPYQSFLKLYKAKQGDYLIALDGFDEKVIPYEIDLAIGDFDTLEAVSYTHLTLPTNSLV